MIAALVRQFSLGVASGSVEIYNEFSLQHEFGLFLRSQSTGLKIQFERNVSHFFSVSTPFTKKEIDICAYSESPRVLSYAVELKYPRNGQYPEQMFSFCKDIAFVEELANAGFSKTAFVVFADERPFYEGKPEGIYSFFRGGAPLHGRITKPTGKKDEYLSISGHYTIQWTQVRGPLRYAVVEVERDR